MKIDELVEMSYSIHLHKIQKQYDATKYKFRLSSNFNNQLSRYFNDNKFNLQDFLQYEPQQAKFRLIISYFINNQQRPVNCSDKDYNKLITQLSEYKNEFNLYFKLVLNNNELFNPKELLRMHYKKEIPFYVFYYIIKFCPFEVSEINSLLIKEALIRTHKTTLFFKVFNEEYIKNICNKVHHYIKLSSF